MHSRSLSSRRLFAAFLPVLAALLLFMPGCGHNHCNSCSSCTSCASDSSSYKAYDNFPPPAPMSPPPPVASTNISGLRGPRSQAEIDATLNSARIQPLPMAPRGPSSVAPNNGVVIIASGEVAWSVPISRQWRHIVVHHSASPTGSAASFDRAHREKGWDGLGYHFVIGNGTGSRDGQVEVGYRWTQQMQGAHAGNYEFNQHGIGICLVGDFEKGGPPSAAQMHSLRSLVAFLQARCSIPTNEIIGHGNVPGRNTECPGRYLDMMAFRGSLNSVYVQPSAAAPVDKTDAKPMLVKAVAKP